MPAIVTTDLRLNEPRYASLPNIMKAKKKPIDEKTPESLRRRRGAAPQVLKTSRAGGPQAGVKVKSVAELVDKLKNEVGSASDDLRPLLLIAEHDNQTLSDATTRR